MVSVTNKGIVEGEGMRYNNPYFSDDVVERVLMHGHRLVDEMCTVRDVAKWSGFSKTTVHSDVVKKLPYIDSDLAEEVQIMLQLSLEEFPIRGGIATAKKWQGR